MIDALIEFYAQISAEHGLDIGKFQDSLHELFSRHRSQNDLNDYRLGKGNWKRLRDEVVPMARYLQWRKILTGNVRFPLNSGYPDCWLQEPGGASPLGIEITIAQGKERFHLSKELVETGQGRGFLGLSDDAPDTDFRRAITSERAMYSTGQALSAIKGGIFRCLRQKNNTKFTGFVLLIEAPLRSLPEDRWSAIAGELQTAAALLPFQYVYVIGNTDESPWGFSIK